jgi:hypothetical protein
VLLDPDGVPLAARRGAAAATVVDVPLPTTAEYDIPQFAVQPDGAAVFAAEPEGDGVGGGLPFTLARVPADGGAPVLRHVDDPATDVLIAPGGAAAVWRIADQDPTFRRIALDGALSAPPTTVRSRWHWREQLALDGRGRLVRSTALGRQVSITLGGGRTHGVATLTRATDAWGFAVGADGTAAVVVVDARRRLRLRLIDPHGHARAARTVGTLLRGGTYALAVDGRGHAHLAWRATKTRIAVRGPGGTRRFAIAPGSGSSVDALQVSARGAELLLWDASGRRYAASTAAP